MTRLHRAALLASTMAATAFAPSAAGQAVEVDDVRRPMPHEGYLTFMPDPLAANRHGAEWHGWVDVRHPAMNGTTATFDPFDRSVRGVEVKAIVVSDNAGQAAAPDIARDFDYACKIWAQAGFSAVRRREATETLALDGQGGRPNVTWPISTTDPDNQMKQHARSAAARAVNLWYVEEYVGANGHRTWGLTSFPSDYAGPPRHDGIGVANKARDNAEPFTPNTTFPHELGHMLFNRGNSCHVADPNNLMQELVTDPTFSQIGPVGGRALLTGAQIKEAYAIPGANMPAGGFIQRPDTLEQYRRYGNRVDWHYVVDHKALQLLDGDGTSAEKLVDEEPGPDVLYFGIGPAPAPAGEPGHDTTGLEAFTHPGAYAQQAFRTVDVFSMSLRYADFDQNAAGAQSLREGALDYSLTFVSDAGKAAAGVPLFIYRFGWTIDSNADNYVVRWAAPFQAVGVRIEATAGAPHDGIAQIDAVIACAAAPVAPAR